MTLANLPRRSPRPRRRIVAAAALAAAAAVVLALVALAAAKALALQIASAGQVNNPAGGTTREPLAVTGAGRAVYFLSGETRQHPKCAAVCQQVWRPVTVAAGAKPAKGQHVPGALGVWRRGALRQLTLGGHPLYTFVSDQHARVATGNGIVSFGGTWHVITTQHTGAAAPAPTTTTSSGTTTTSSYRYGY